MQLPLFRSTVCEPAHRSADQAADKGLAALCDAPPPRRNRLHEMRPVAFFEHGSPGLLRRHRRTTARGEGESR